MLRSMCRFMVIRARTPISRKPSDRLPRVVDAQPVKAGISLFLNLAKRLFQKISCFFDFQLMSWKTEPCFGKQSPVLENRALFWKTEPCSGKQSPVLETRDRKR